MIGSVGASSGAVVSPSVSHSPSSSYPMSGRKSSSGVKGYAPSMKQTDYPGNDKLPLSVSNDKEDFLSDCIVQF